MVKGRKTSFLVCSGLVALFALSLMSCITQRDYTRPKDLQSLVSEKNQKYLLIDVRMPQEFSEGHIPTSVNIPVGDLQKVLSNEDRSLLVVVYCQSGRRSSLAKKTLDGMGFTSVVNFGAISNWPGDLVK